ncbi:hypothetical protein JCM8097_004958 [Rhodosporidiobolus ruineniae]
MSSKTAAKDAALLAVASAVPTIALPPPPTLSSSLWCQHSSFLGATHHEFELPEGEQATDYERLEHVGDALLGAEITLLVHERYPRLSVGARTVAKSVLVSNTTLSVLSTSLSFPSLLLASQAQLLTFRSNPSIQANIFEAYLAALYEEHGAAALREFVRRLYEPLLPVAVEALRPFHVSQAEAAMPSRNYVGALLEWSQAKGARGIRRAEFGSNRESANGAERLWSVDVAVADAARAETSEGRVFEGSASTVAKAKMAAAWKACQWLGIA